MTDRVAPGSTVAYLGPPGTFTEEALRTQPDLAAATLLAQRSFAHVLVAVEEQRADYGFVAIENAIEGSVLAALDELVFERDLRLVREVLLPVSQNILAPAGTALEDVRRVVSFPVATAQCRAWLSRQLPDAEEVAATSTSEAVRLVAAGEAGAGAAAIGTALAASLYGLPVLAAGIEDHEHNVTRFVLVAPPSTGVPAPTGHDKTSIVCFQAADRPGSLHGILGQFSARDINLVKLESRPTKRALGDYCFIIDFEGHVAEEMVADCLRDLHTTLREVKFLGSYPAAGEAGPRRRRDARSAWAAADDWIASIRRTIRPAP
ncbi:MAG: prephenate dehydratase [Acidimicrobiales bacterium]